MSYKGRFLLNLLFVSKNILTYATNRLFLSLRQSKGRSVFVLCCIFCLYSTITNAATYYSRATGNWANAGTWSTTSGGSAGTNYPGAGDNVIIERGYTVTIGANAACTALTFRNTNNGSSILTISGAYTLAVSGAISMNLPAAGYDYTFNINSGTVTCGSLTLSATNTNPRRNYVNITTGSLSCSGATTTGGVSSILSISSTGSINFGGNVTGTTPTLNTVAGSTVTYSGGNQNVIATNYSGNLTLSGTNTKTLTTSTSTIGGNLTISGSTTTSAVAGLTIGGDVTLGSGSTFVAGNYTHTISGNWINNGATFTNTNSTIYLNTANKTIGGSATTTFNNLRLENNGTTTLGVNTAINGVLTLNNSLLNLGSYNLTMGASASFSSWYLSSAAMVVADGTGELRRTYSGTGSFTFPIGDNSDGTANYSPVTVNVTSGTFSSAYIATRVTDAKHPQNTNTTNYLTRYWTISQSGISNPVATITGTYNSEDIVGTESYQYAFKYASSAWTQYSAMSSNTLTATGVSTFGDFTGYSVPAFTINSGSSLTGFTYGEDYGPSNPQYLQFSATALNDSALITPPTGYEVSTAYEGPYKSTLKIGPTSGNINWQSVYLRLKSGLTVGAYSGNVTISSAGAISATTTVSGTVTATIKYYRSKTSGNWNSPSTWEQSLDNTNWVSGVSYPTSSQYIAIIQSGHKVTLTAAATASSLTINGELDLSTYTLTGTGTLTNNGILYIGGSSNFPTGFTTTTLASTSTVNYNGSGAQTVASRTFAGNLTLSGSGTKTLSTGTTSIGGNFSIINTATSSTVVGLTVSGNLAVGDGATFNVGGYNLTVSGTTTVGGGTSGTLNITSTAGTKTFVGDVTLNNGSSWVESVDVNLIYGGSFANNAGTFTIKNGRHIFNGASKSFSGNTTITIPRMNITGSYTNYSTLNITGSLTGSGTLTQGSDAILNIGDSCLITNLDASITHNTVDYNKAGPQTIKRTTYDYLILQGSGIKTFPAGTTTINSLLSREGTSSVTISGALNYTSGAILQYKGSASQTTGSEFPTSFNSTGGVIINNSYGVILNSARTISAGTLTMVSGVLTTTTTNSLSITNTLSSAIKGGSSSSFINGPVIWTLPANLVSGSSYTFPVGNGTTYLPFTLVNPTTGTGTTTAQVQAFAASAGGTTNSTISSISTTEYWNLSTVGNFTNSGISASRPSLISPYNTLAASTSKTGTYTILTGTLGNYGISSSANIGTNRYFTFGQGKAGVNKSVSSLTGFTYKERMGPSASQSFTVSGFELSDNLKIEAQPNTDLLNCYEVSTDNITFGSSVTLTVTDGVVNLSTIYVREKAGLAQGNYAAKLVFTSNGLKNDTISCSGDVTIGPSVSASVSSLSGFTYKYSSSTSTSQSFTIAGSNLADTVKVTAPEGFEVCTSSNGTYSSVAYYNTGKSATLGTSAVYIRLKLGLGVGTYNGNTVVSSSGAVSQNIATSGTITQAATITLSQNLMGAFIYAYNSGPSAAQKVKIFGTNLSSTTVTVTSTSTNFVISKTPGGTYGATLSYTASSGTLTDSVYIKMAAGLSVGSYGPSSITVASNTAITKSIGCVGKVVAAANATIYTSVSSLSGFGYQYSAASPAGILQGGPSSPQAFVVSGAALSGDITVNAPDSFEISLSPSSGYVKHLSVSCTGTIINPTTIYVRLKSGLSVNPYTGSVTITGGGASSVSVPLNSAKVYASPMISATGGNSYCPGNTITLGYTGDDIQSLYWTGPNSYYVVPNVGASTTLTTNATSSLSGDYIVTGNVVVGGNLVYNGDFESGNVGFGSAYNYRDSTYNSGSGFGALYNEGDYSVLTIPSHAHTNFTTNGPNGGRKQMVINGSPTAGVVIWSQSVAVLPNSDYQFTYYEQNVCNPNPSKLQLYVNGVAAGPVYTASSTVGSWTRYLYNASSGSNTILNLELVNQNTVTNGNDFALDNIEFRQVMSAKDTAAVSVGEAVPVSVTITASINPSKSGSYVTYTATPVNGGDTPTYQWYVNGTSIADATGTTYQYIPSNSDQIKCVLTSSITCTTGNPATSNTISQVVNIVAKNYWMGTNSTDWGTASNWTNNEVPTAGDDVEFATSTNYGLDAVNDLYVDSVRTVGNLINNTTYKVVIGAGKRLYVNYSIYTDNNPARILVKADNSNPSGVLIFHNGQNYPVYGTVEMYSKSTIVTSGATKTFNWQYFGIPVTTVVASPTLDGAYVRQWYEEDSSIQTHWKELNNSSVLVPFYGYEICQTNAHTYTFKGRLVNSDFYADSVNYRASAAAGKGRLPYTSTGAYPGQTIFANPYTSPIDIKAMLFGSQTEATVYQYNTGSYTSWNSTGGTASSSDISSPGQYVSSTKSTAGILSIPRYVPPMGNLLVRALSKSANATFGFVYNNVVANTKAPIQRAKAMTEDTITEDDSKISTRIEVKGKNGSDNVWLFTDAGCSTSYNRNWDAEKLTGLVTAPQMYAIGDDGNYQIKASNNIANTTLAFKAGSDNDYTIYVTHKNLHQKYPNLYLVDVIRNTVTDVTNDSSSYAFSAVSTANAVNRFKIAVRYYEKGATDNNSEIKIFAGQKAIYVHNMSNYQGNVTVFDITGRKVTEKPIDKNEVIMINSGIYTGPYIVRCSTTNENISKRLIVE